MKKLHFKHNSIKNDKKSLGKKLTQFVDLFLSYFKTLRSDLINSP